MNCDMCGSEENLFRATIEGSELKVCRNCSKHGKVLGPVVNDVKIEKKKRESITVEELEPETVEMKMES